MLEQEIASAIKFILEACGNPNPYYHKVEQDFLVPAVYFPIPEIESRGFTFQTYALSYSWFVMFFHGKEELAYRLGFDALCAIQSMRNTIPLIDGDGEYTGESFLLKDPSLRKVENAAQLYLRWDSARPYYEPEKVKAQEFNYTLYTKNAYDGAVWRIKNG